MRPARRVAGLEQRSRRRAELPDFGNRATAASTLITQSGLTRVARRARRPIDAKLHCCCRCPAGENGSKRPLPRRRPPRLASARKPKPTSPTRTLFDNQLALNAGWDLEMLSLEIGELGEAGFDLSLTGFDEFELGELFAERTQGRIDPDDAPEPPVHPARGVNPHSWPSVSFYNRQIFDSGARGRLPVARATARRRGWRAWHRRNINSETAPMRRVLRGLHQKPVGNKDDPI